MPERDIEDVVRDLIERPWTMEDREGVAHYAPQVRVDSGTAEGVGRLYVVAFAPPDGHSLCVVLCEHDEHWRCVGGYRIRPTFGQVRELPATFMLSRGMVAALDEARKAVTKEAHRA